MSVLEPLTLQVQVPKVQPGRRDSRRGQQRPAGEGGKAPERAGAPRGRQAGEQGRRPWRGAGEG